MISDENQDADTGAESGEESKEDVVTLARDEYAKLNETMGSLKRDLKDAKKALESKDSEKVDTKPDNELLKRLDKLALKTAGINGADEVELFEKWRAETGREAEVVIENSIFNKELAELRTARANLAATSNVKGEAGESGARNTPEYWIAKATKGNDGKLLFPEETPKELYSKIVDKMVADNSLDKNKLKFYNE